MSNWGDFVVQWFLDDIYKACGKLIVKFTLVCNWIISRELIYSLRKRRYPFSVSPGLLNQLRERDFGSIRFFWNRWSRVDSMFEENLDQDSENFHQSTMNVEVEFEIFLSKWKDEENISRDHVTILNRNHNLSE